jgi:hypothetical protein
MISRDPLSRIVIGAIIEGKRVRKSLVNRHGLDREPASRLGHHTLRTITLYHLDSGGHLM